MRIEDAEQLAASTQYSDLVEPRINIDIPRTCLKRELAELVVSSFDEAGYDELPTRASERNRGLWTWLAAASFHLIRSRAVRNGKPNLRNYSYYILGDEDLRYYRHRVAGPARIHWILRNTPQSARIFLNSEIDQVSEFEERLAVNMRYISKPELMKVVNSLYLDPKTLRQKRGCVSAPNTRGGVLKRFMNVIDQLDRTYDLHSMDADQILDLLPPEFDRWKPTPVV
ncbi:MAG: hypothetical protein F4Y88_03940 [Chloroflexi bacterium]|nr:hypothetical protein [Chloroflexota bacterium]